MLVMPAKAGIYGRDRALAFAETRMIGSVGLSSQDPEWL
jgi:hypothetical protein